MAKKKNTIKAGISDAVYNKKSSSAIARNPAKTNAFEVHINREKYSVLNRDKKNDRGLPGVSRAKAVKKRHETLGVELSQMHKSNRFKDKRLSGGRFRSGEDLATAKFSKEMQQRYESNTSKRTRLFNLNDDDCANDDSEAQMLTHKGQTLREIEQFQDDLSGDDDHEDSEMLNAEFTDAAHFGGGPAMDEDRRSRKDMIDDLIVEAKKRKAEAAKEKDQVTNLTEKLDNDWRALAGLMGKITRDDKEWQKPDAYDRTRLEMQFDRRGEPTDKLISKEELEKKEREKKERLEQDRLRRMEEDSEGRPKSNHRSADDLDDDYGLIGEPKEGDEPDNEGEQSDDDDNDENETDENEDSEDASEDDDNLSDLKSSEDEEESDEDKEQKQHKLSVAKKYKQGTAAEHTEFETDLPSCYEELLSILKNQSTKKHNDIIGSLIESNSPKLDGANRERLVPFLAFILQYINDLFDSDSLTSKSLSNSFKIFNVLVPHVYDLAQINPIATANLVREIIKEKQEDFGKQKDKKYPSLETFVFLKLISALFSTSDFKHGVVTPANVFISQMLTRSSIERGQDVARGLFLATIALEYSALSKRFLPAVMVFLHGCLVLAVPKETIEVIKLGAPFKSSPVYNSLLTYTAEHASKMKAVVPKVTNEALKMMAADLIREDDPETEAGFRLRCINTVFVLLKSCLGQLESNNASMYYSQDIMPVLKRIDPNVYPEPIKLNYSELLDQLTCLQDRKLVHLQFRDQPVKQLKLLEPKFDSEQFGDRRKRKPSEKSLLEAMRHKVKREMKGALRDIKLDNAFVSKMRMKKQRELDRDRKEKVKRIFAEASMQQSELNAMDRQNKRKKK